MICLSHLWLWIAYLLQIRASNELSLVRNGQWAENVEMRSLSFCQNGMERLNAIVIDLDAGPKSEEQCQQERSFV
jgi:hypothetical protein